MNLANTITGLESPAGNWQEKGEVRDNESTIVNTQQRILKSALVALGEGNISEVLDRFGDHFTFTDCALTLEFTSKLRLAEFFEKSRDLFPDTKLETVAFWEEGDHAMAQWMLSATQTVPHGSIRYQLPISLFGATIVRIENERIVEWFDYHDQSPSRRWV